MKIVNNLVNTIILALPDRVEATFVRALGGVTFVLQGEWVRGDACERSINKDNNKHNENNNVYKR